MIRMKLFGRKKEELPEPPAEFRIDENANWHVFSDRAFEKAREENIPAATVYWCDAIDRYDEDSSKYLLKLRRDIFDLVSSQMLDYAHKGKIVPTQMIAEVDAEAMIKHGDSWTTPLSEDLFYFAKENVSECEGPESASMLFIAGAYSIVGYLRFSSDPVESAEKCREVSRLGTLTADQCASYGRMTYKGGLKPKQGRGFCLTVVAFFDTVADALEKAVSELSGDELEKIKNHRELDRFDRLEHLAAALQIVLGSSVDGHLPKRKKGDAIERELSLYIGDFFRSD